jgi:hypothetical protein
VQLKKIAKLADIFFSKQLHEFEEHLKDEALDEEIEYDEPVVESLEDDIEEEIQFSVEIDNSIESNEIAIEKVIRKQYAPRKPGGGRKLYQCECGIIFSSQHRLNNHIKVKHEILSESELLPCNMCEKK